MTPMENVLLAAGQLAKQSEDLRSFAPWPQNLTESDIRPSEIPAITHFMADFSEIPLPPENAALLKAVKAAAQFAKWRQTYTQEEVGYDFLQRYGYFELIGPTGHFHCDASRVFVAYWGSGLHYPWHDHIAEELYYVVAGSAEFHIKGRSRILQPGGTQQHQSRQPHAMTTLPSGDGVLALIPWRGDGLDLMAQMTNSN